MTAITGWLESVHGFDPERWWAFLSCTNRKRHEPAIVGLIYTQDDGIYWSPRTEPLAPGEVAAAMDPAERDDILEWDRFVARDVIKIDGVPAFLPGHPVPASHVARGVVSREQVDEHEPHFPALGRVYMGLTRIDAETVAELRQKGVRGQATFGRGSINATCEHGCTIRVSREDFEKLLDAAPRVGTGWVDLSLYA